MVKTSRYLCVGPGGMKCVCCFQAPRSKDRRAQWRSAKRKADREAMREIEAQMLDHQAMLKEDDQRELELYCDQYFYDDNYDNYLMEEHDSKLEEELEREYYRQQDIGYDDPIDHHYYYDD